MYLLFLDLGVDFNDYEPPFLEYRKSNQHILENYLKVFKHKKSYVNRFGALGAEYLEKKYSVHKGGQRVTRAVQLGYTHIEAIVYE